VAAGRHGTALAWGLAAAVVLGGCGPAATPTPPPASRPSATAFDGLPQVGALFAGSSDDGLHFCTASVVHSPAHDLIVTAAHCLSGAGTDLAFAPMYHDGVAPFGTWAVEAAYVGAGWLASRDPHQDVAFLTVAPEEHGGRTVEVEDTTGADRLVVSSGLAARATVVGYALGTGGRPVTCTTAVYDHAGYRAFDCDGFAAGTSGSPWIADAGRNGRGELIGVIGGLHQGGCTASTSYSSSFDAATLALYRRAERGGPGDTVPAAGSDGCPSPG
jgi:V8-like Glu-specific endopeptidase